MADILKESVLLLRSIHPYSELIKDFSSNENIKELPMFKRKASSEESLIPRNIKKLSENKKNSKYTQRPNELDLKISCAIVLYQRFYSRIPNLQDVKNYLYCIEVLIEHLISEYYDNLEDIKKILQNYFFYEIRSALYVLKETMLKDSPVYNKEKIEILKLFIDFLDANRKNLNDYYNSSKFIGDLKIILINIEGFTSDISTIDPETIHFEIEILKDNIYEIILNKFFESEESNMYLLSIIENRSIDKEYKNEIIKKIKSFSIKSHYPMGSLMLDSVEELLPNYFEFKLIDINKSREFVRNFKIKYQNIIEKSISQFLGNKIENQLNPDLVLVQLISTFVEFYSVLHPKMVSRFVKPSGRT